MNEIVSVETKGIVPQQPRELTPAVWSMIERIGTAAYKARMYKGITSPESAAMVMLKGWELGFGISASFEFIQPIMNKFELIPRGALALLHGHPDIERIDLDRLEKDGVFHGYACTIKRTNGFSYTASFTMEDAARAGLLKPDSGWMKYPENMCMWRSIGFCADVAAPDICSGMTSVMKMPEEYNVVVSAEGDVIDVAPLNIEPPEHVTLEMLADRFGGAAILAANGGLIPDTEERCRELWRELGG